MAVGAFGVCHAGVEAGGDCGGSLLYTDGPVLRRYYVDTDTMTGLARDLLTRELTDQECETYAVDCA